MSVKIIVSYDGTANEDDAIALGRLLSAADGGARQTAEALSAALGATVAPVANEDADLLLIDSRPEAQPGHVSLSASAEHLIEIATCPVLVVPRGVTLPFARATVGSAAA